MSASWRYSSFKSLWYSSSFIAFQQHNCFKVSVRQITLFRYYKQFPSKWEKPFPWCSHVEISIGHLWQYLEIFYMYGPVLKSVCVRAFTIMRQRLSCHCFPELCLCRLGIWGKKKLLLRDFSLFLKRIILFYWL